MKASEWIKGLPEAPGFARDQYVLEAVIAGHHLPIRWCPLSTAKGQHSGTVWVAEDALRIGEPGDCVRITVSHRLAQLIVDHFDARLPTSRISDLAWEQATVRLPDLVRPWWADGTMSTNARMVEQDRAIETLIASRPGLVADVGKDWILSRQHEWNPSCGVNYGIHYRKMGQLRVWQPTSTKHNLDHHDYSQTLRLVCRTAEVDGQRMPLDQVLRAKELAPLVSNEGALTILRHPAVAWAEPLAPLEDP
jgi:hypothetical protein